MLLVCLATVCHETHRVVATSLLVNRRASKTSTACSREVRGSVRSGHMLSRSGIGGAGRSQDPVQARDLRSLYLPVSSCGAGDASVTAYPAFSSNVVSAPTSSGSVWITSTADAPELPRGARVDGVESPVLNAR